MKVTLTMDEEMARHMMFMSEFYARVVCGQYELISDRVLFCRERLLDEKQTDHPEDQKSEAYRQRHDAETILLHAKHIQFPELEPVMGHHWGLGYSRKTDIAYNIHQAIWYAYSGVRFPDQSSWQRTEPIARNLPYPGILIDGREYLDGHFDVPSDIATFQEDEG